MRLNEVLNGLLEYDKGGVESEVSSDLKGFMDSIGEFKKLGNGAYGVAFEKPGDVNTVIKTGHFSIVRKGNGKFDDAYVNYIIGLQKVEGASNNPYFPQVYNIKFYEDSEKNNAYKYSIELEKLRPLKFNVGEFDTYKGAMEYLEGNPHSMFSQVMVTIDRVLNISSEEFLKGLLGTDGEIPYAIDLGSAEIFDYLESKVFNQYILYGSPGRIKIVDDTMLEAVNILREVKGRGMGMDMHDLNVMYRPTPYGMQWVFVDPFA